jgi:hypothetical protein
VIRDEVATKDRGALILLGIEEKISTRREEGRKKTALFGCTTCVAEKIGGYPQCLLLFATVHVATEEPVGLAKE